MNEGERQITRRGRPRREPPPRTRRQIIRREPREHPIPLPRRKRGPLRREIPIHSSEKGPEESLEESPKRKVTFRRPRRSSPSEKEIPPEQNIFSTIPEELQKKILSYTPSSTLGTAAVSKQFSNVSRELLEKRKEETNFVEAIRNDDAAVLAYLIGGFDHEELYEVWIMLLGHYPLSIQCSAYLIERIVGHPSESEIQLLSEKPNILTDIRDHDKSKEQLSLIFLVEYLRDYISSLIPILDDEQIRFLFDRNVITLKDLVFSLDKLSFVTQEEFSKIEFILSLIDTVNLETIILNKFTSHNIQMIWNNISWNAPIILVNKVIEILISSEQPEIELLVLDALKKYKMLGHRVYFEEWFLDLIKNSIESVKMLTRIKRQILENNLISILDEIDDTNIDLQEFSEISAIFPELWYELERKIQ